MPVYFSCFALVTVLYLEINVAAGFEDDKWGKSYKGQLEYGLDQYFIYLFLFL